MNNSPTPAPELVVLVAPDGTPIGQTEKATVHHADTPMHLAFSCYVVNERGELLLTRRALTKATWPGVWTNSFCGHPAPGETFEDAIMRRARYELGLELTDIAVVLPEFRYRAVDASGVVEHEFCPVFTAVTATEPVPNPDEVVEYAWTEFNAAQQIARSQPFLLSPWAVNQLRQLERRA